MSSSNNKGSGGSGQGNSSSSGGSRSSNSQIVKDGWGSRPNFQASYGHPMTPEGIAEGNQILDAMRESDNAAASGKK